VVVIGGGPAGSFFAIQLLRKAKRLGRNLEVIIIEKRGPTDAGLDEFQCRGCNFCAGLISPRLSSLLDEEGFVVPAEVVQGHIDYVWIQGQWKNFRLRVPQDVHMYSVFRGSLPGRRPGRPAGFDGFLLHEAVKEGAYILYGEVQAISYTASGMPSLIVKTPPNPPLPQDSARMAEGHATCVSPSAANLALDASFVTIATGINAHCGQDYRGDPLIKALKQFNPAFVPVKSRRALIFELDVGEEYLRRNLHREIYFVEYGSKRLALEHTALVPKGRFLTVAMIGKAIDQAVLPRESHRIIHEFLALPQIDRILPDISTAPVTCACTPRMAIMTANCPFADRVAIVGDAAGSRLNKDGLFSAYATASRLAHTVLADGVDQPALARSYGQAINWLAADNRFGEMVFGISRMAFTRPLLSRIVYQAFATEYKVREERSRPLTGVLWKIASGTADYREVLRQMLGGGVLRSIFTGAGVTLRNVAIEALLGLKWGAYGRYPTVVLKEKREVLKQDLARRLGEPFAGSADFERMYVIKIRGAAKEIMDELSRFGRATAKFVNLRFVKVRHMQGVPNEIGSVVQYRMPLLGLGSEMKLAKRVGFQTLLYEVDERLVDHGRLIFNIAPSKDGNSRLAIYTSFDYKRGKHVAGRMMWAMVRLLFPEFVHDVVWNHALCTVKQEVERRSGPPGGR
jgi:hypothetical protein